MRGHSNRLKLIGIALITTIGFLAYVCYSGSSAFHFFFGLIEDPFLATLYGVLFASAVVLFLIMNYGAEIVRLTKFLFAVLNRSWRSRIIFSAAIATLYAAPWAYHTGEEKLVPPIATRAPIRSHAPAPMVLSNPQRSLVFDTKIDQLGVIARFIKNQSAAELVVADWHRPISKPTHRRIHKTTMADFGRTPLDDPIRSFGPIGIGICIASLPFSFLLAHEYVDNCFRAKTHIGGHERRRTQT